MNTKTIENILRGYKVIYRQEHDLNNQIIECRNVQDDLIRAICSEVNNEELNDYIYKCIAYHGGKTGEFDISDCLSDIKNLIESKGYYESIVRGFE